MEGKGIYSYDESLFVSITSDYKGHKKGQIPLCSLPVLLGSIKENCLESVQSDTHRGRFVQQEGCSVDQGKPRKPLVVHLVFSSLSGTEKRNPFHFPLE